MALHVALQQEEETDLLRKELREGGLLGGLQPVLLTFSNEEERRAHQISS